MPNIGFKIDKEKDLNEFYLFLFNNDRINKYPFVKKGLYFTFKNLKNNIENTINQEEKNKILVEFINELYKKHENDLIVLKEYIENLFKDKAVIIFEGLEKTMDYKFNEDEFNLYLTFLTVSTFNKSSASISILNDLGKKEFTTPYIDIFIHEVSHIVFWEKIKILYNNNDRLDQVSYDYLKEIFAPIIIRDNIFNNIRQGNQHKFANTQQQLLNVSIKGNSENIIDYFENIYIDGKNNGLSFDEILKQSYNIFSGIQNQINEKNKLFFSLNSGENMNSPEFKDKLLKNGYGETIEINATSIKLSISS